MLSIHLLGLI